MRLRCICYSVSSWDSCIEVRALYKVACGAGLRKYYSFIIFSKGYLKRLLDSFFKTELLLVDVEVE